ncbi:ABC transporter ATP-binding protein [Sporosarcina thermotolerans]|uniref:ABC transporter ATP-binding protein n=1 Tax=Sporosarcina thermotolerans TaxID=633404 RepID=A0AAW9AFL2_9BACL|nr:ABC transporter ATP-binding protein [Sporosarcina thermotolerans]MDW0117851.1 ABC transporter ATP-binding protein [Sporosarcina thermotolerans]
METVIDIINLTKEFKGKKAVEDVSFSIKKGEVVAILGPNGAGKSTTILMMLGLLNPTSGKVSLFNQQPQVQKVRERIGVMLQQVSLMDALKVKEVLALFRSYYPSPLSLEEMIRLTGLGENELKKRTEKLSGGQKRRVSFALAMVGNPDLVFFDEPTVGMDSTARREFWATVRQLSEAGKTVIFSTHYLQEADDAATRILLFNKGKLVADGSPSTIKQRLLKKTVSFKVQKEFPKEQFLTMDHISVISEEKGRIVIQTEDTDRVIASLFTEGLQISDISIDKGRLEDAFEQLTVEQGVS